MPLLGVSMPSLAIVSLNTSRSSPRSMASRFTPITFTPYLSRMPFFARLVERLRPVCPPRFGKMASGLSFAMICSRRSSLSGSMYVASAITGSVMMVAGLEFTNTTLYPQARRALHACVPE